MNRRAYLSHPHKTDFNQKVFEAKPVKLEPNDNFKAVCNALTTEVLVS